MEKIMIYTLENDEEYNEISTLNYNGTKYLLLSNVKNPKDTCIRKVMIDNGKEYICRLKKDELVIVLDLFVKQSSSSL